MITKIGKWIKRRFRKTLFFVKDLKNKNFDLDVYHDLIFKIEKYMTKKPWKVNLDQDYQSKVSQIIN